MKFTDMLWQEIEPIYQAIITHPFINELRAGTLSRERFQFYMQQDALYLADYGRALAALGSRSPTPGRLLDFVKFAEGAVVVERALHEQYFKIFDIDHPTQEQSPSCFAYTNYLLATVSHRSYEEGIAALLPCFWIYRKVGTEIHRGAGEHNPYYRWIITYAGEDFGKLVDKALEITEETAEKASTEGRELMRRAFITSSRLEWMFWDSAYRLEVWQPQ